MYELYINILTEFNQADYLKNIKEIIHDFDQLHSFFLKSFVGIKFKKGFPS